MEIVLIHGMKSYTSQPICTGLLAPRSITSGQRSCDVDKLCWPTSSSSSQWMAPHCRLLCIWPSDCLGGSCREKSKLLNALYDNSCSGFRIELSSAGSMTISASKPHKRTIEFELATEMKGELAWCVWAQVDAANEHDFLQHSVNI